MSEAMLRAARLLVLVCRQGRDVCASEFADAYWPSGSRVGKPSWKLVRPATAMLVRLEKAGMAQSHYGSGGMQHRWRPTRLAERSVS